MRVKTAVPRNRRRRKIMKAARGFRGARKNLLRVAKDGVMRARAYAFVHRRLRKREFRALWITRINAASRQHGLTYSQFMGLLIKAGVELDRKSLSELAISDPAAFTRVVETARSAA